MTTMWDAIAEILTNANALIVLLFITLFAFILILLAKSGLVQIHTSAFRMGADHRERDIIRQQIEWTHSYIMGIESQIEGVDKSRYNGYYTKYILEYCFDEILAWIAFNHINLESDYISIKQEKIKSIIRGFDIDPKFRTKEFEKRIDRWTEEVIKKLVVIREVYK